MLLSTLNIPMGYESELSEKGFGKYNNTDGGSVKFLFTNTISVFSNFILNFYCYSTTVVCLFSPSHHPTSAEHTSLPCLHPPPWFCPYVLYSSSCNPLFPLSPPHTPLAIVILFLTSMSLVIFCLLFFFC